LVKSRVWRNSSAAASIAGCCAIWPACGTLAKIQDISLQQRVLEHMRSAERGLRRLEAALDKLAPEALLPVLRQHRLTSIERIDNLELLKRVVLELESAGEKGF
jgi:hypothetical protein